jgi:DNA-directed RNA polymerase specialized sigma24 family protein
MPETSLSLLDRLRHQAAPSDWERLVQLYAPLLRRWLARQPLQTTDADDLLQDVLTVVVKLPDFRRQAPPPPRRVRPEAVHRRGADALPRAGPGAA